jgi:hypothetical protein
MSQAPVPKKTFSGIIKQFDSVAEKTKKSGLILSACFNSVADLNRPDNYSYVRNELKKRTEFMEKIPFLKRFALEPAPLSHRANNISRYFGGSTAFMALAMVRKAPGNPVKAGLVVGALIALSKTNYSAPLAFVMTKIGFSSTVVTALAPVLMTGLTITFGFSMLASWQVQKMRQAGKFIERKQTITDEITHLLETGGLSPTPKLDKLVKAYERSFKPDFSPQQTQAIRDALAVGRSESGISATLTPSQDEALTKIVNTLTKQYFVPVHLATNAGLNMIVEMNGNEKAVMAKLKSRNIEEDWVNRFKMEPLATIEGSRRNGKVIDEQSPKP